MNKANNVNYKLSYTKWNITLLVKVTLYLITVLNFKLPALAQKTDSIISYQSLLANKVTEKPYLQFSRKSFANGDTVKFKTYLLLGEKNIPSKLSSVVHLQLITPNGNAILHRKIKITNGVAIGELIIPDTLPSGIYGVTAYTNWALNMRKPYYALQIIAVKNINGGRQNINVVNAKSNPRIDFYPEGGRLLEGTACNIAFHAISPTGKGLKVNGRLYDSTGVEVAKLFSKHAGFGIVSLVPRRTSYYAELIDEKNNAYKVKLPPVSPDGIIISANNDSLGKVVLNVKSTVNYFKGHKKEPYEIVITSGGIKTSVSFNLEQEEMRFDVQKKNLKTGVAIFSLLSGKSTLSERLAFVRSRDELHFTHNVEEISKDSIKIIFHVKNRKDDPINGNFSVDIGERISKEGSFFHESIVSDLLLTSVLSNFIESPNYYVSDLDDERSKDLDVMLLTQTYLRQEPISEKVIFTPESFLSISGQMSDSKNTPIIKGKVYLIEQTTNTLLPTETDGNGRFIFQGLDFRDSIAVVINGTDKKGNKNVKISIDKEPQINLRLLDKDRNAFIYALYDSAAFQGRRFDKREQNSTGTIRGKLLNEVKVTSFRTTQPYRTMSLAGAGHADQVIHTKDIRGGGTLASILNGRLRGVVFNNGVPLQTSVLPVKPMMIVVDGIILPNQSDAANINDISFSDVETVEVLKSANASIYGMSSGGGVLVITTKAGGNNGTSPDGKSAAVTKFLSEGYSNSSISLNAVLGSADGSHFFPQVISNQEGDIVIRIPKSRVKSKVLIEGVSLNGELGYYDFSL